jgi:hypothetical protein
VVVAIRNHESERTATMSEGTPIPGPLNNVIQIDDIPGPLNNVIRIDDEGRPTGV